MKKTTKTEFNRFKKEFLRWQERLGLTQYQVYFFLKKLEDNFAEIKVIEINKVVSVSLNSELDHVDATVDKGPEGHAKHKALHLLTHRLMWLGESRYIERSDLGEEWEAIVGRLCKVLK